MGGECVKLLWKSADAMWAWSLETNSCGLDSTHRLVRIHHNITNIYPELKMGNMQARDHRGLHIFLKDYTSQRVYCAVLYANHDSFKQKA